VARLTNATGCLDTKNGFALNLALLLLNYGVVLFWVAIAKTNVAFAGVADRGYPNIGWFNIWFYFCRDESPGFLSLSAAVSARDFILSRYFWFSTLTPSPALGWPLAQSLGKP
jgi:hypothetical protein